MVRSLVSNCLTFGTYSPDFKFAAVTIQANLPIAKVNLFKYKSMQPNARYFNYVIQSLKAQEQDHSHSEIAKAMDYLLNTQAHVQHRSL